MSLEEQHGSGADHGVVGAPGDDLGEDEVIVFHAQVRGGAWLRLVMSLFAVSHWNHLAAELSGTHRNNSLSSSRTLESPSQPEERVTRYSIR